jgi:hypothetical protein
VVEQSSRSIRGIKPATVYLIIRLILYISSSVLPSGLDLCIATAAEGVPSYNRPSLSSADFGILFVR